MYARIKDVLSEKFKDGDEVEIGGWVAKNRSSGKIVFTLIRDATGEIQVTTKKGNVCDEALKVADALTLECSVIVKGKVRLDRVPPEAKS